MDVDEKRIVECLNRLEKEGLIEKKLDLNDKKWEYRATDIGTTAALSIIYENEEMIKDFFEGIEITKDLDENSEEIEILHARIIGTLVSVYSQGFVLNKDFDYKKDLNKKIEKLLKKCKK